MRRLKLKHVAANLEAFGQKKQRQIDSITTFAHHDVRAGEKLQLNIAFTGENGAELTRKVEYEVPIGMEPGTLFFTVADANIANIADFRQVLTTTPRSPVQIVSTVNNLHPNTSAYVRVWRADPAYQLEGSDLPDPPASIAPLFSRQFAIPAPTGLRKPATRRSARWKWTRATWWSPAPKQSRWK